VPVRRSLEPQQAPHTAGGEADPRAPGRRLGIQKSIFVCGCIPGGLRQQSRGGGAAAGRESDVAKPWAKGGPTNRRLCRTGCDPSPPEKAHTFYNFHGVELKFGLLSLSSEMVRAARMDKGSINLPVLTQYPTKIGQTYGKVWKSGGRERQYTRSGRTERIKTIELECQ